MHFVKHLSTAILNLNNTVSKNGGGRRGFQGVQSPPASELLSGDVYTFRIKAPGVDGSLRQEVVRSIFDYMLFLCKILRTPLSFNR